MAAASRTRQKGTGNARQGSIRAPHFSGGGVALGPKPRKYDQKTPKKMIKLALRSALSDRANEGKIVVVDCWGFDAPKTKAAKEALAALGIDGTALVVVGRDDAAAALSFRNLPEVQLIAPGELNAYDVLCNDWIVFTQDAASPAPPSQPAEAPHRRVPTSRRREATPPTRRRADDRQRRSMRQAEADEPASRRVAEDRAAAAPAPPRTASSASPVTRSRATPTRCCTTARQPHYSQTIAERGSPPRSAEAAGFRSRQPSRDATDETR